MKTRLSFPPKLDLANIPTPLQPLSTLSKSWGIDLRIKRDDLTGTILSGNKIRKLEYLLYEAKHKQCDCIITCGASTSNHVRATVLAAKKLGMDSFLILSGDEPQVATGNLQLDLMLGAEAEYISWNEYQRSIDEYLQKRADRLKEQGRNPYIIPTGGSNGLGLVGYTEAAFEIEDQCKEQDWYPDYVICAVGSGGTYAGLLAGKLASSFTGHVLGILVCASITYFQDKIIQDFEEAKKLHNWPLQLDPKEILLNNRNIFGGYAQASPELFRFLRYVAEAEAVILEPVYTGKAFYGLWQEIQNKNIPKGARVLFIHTGGVFGLPAFAEQMTQEWDSVHRWENRFDKG